MPVEHLVRPVTMSTEGVPLPAEPRSDKSEVQLPTVEQVIARVQQLCDTPRPEGGYPLAAYVEGWFLGDHGHHSRSDPC